MLKPMSEGSEPSLDITDLQNIFRNKHRKIIVRELYREPKKYVDLLRLTGLKPGSIYHHLRVLDSIVEKNDTGWYQLSQFGLKVSEALEISDVHTIKPVITSKEKKISTQSLSSVFSEDTFAIIWEGKVLKILLAYTILITLALSLSGVAVAGSAIYQFEHTFVIIFDIVAFLFGLGILILFETFQKSRNLYGSYKFSLFIRLMSSLPAVIFGTALYLLFLLDRTINTAYFPLIFTITVVLGLFVSASGIYYLRNENWITSLRIMSIVIFVDLLFGFALLVTESSK